MSISSQSGKVITLEQAIEYTHTYQIEHPEKTKSFFVGLDKLNLILSQNDCIGLRIYLGEDPDSSQTNMVLVGVDSNQEDLTKGTILEELVPCPRICPKTSELVKRE